jgi:ornithine carbamoyltransferase
MTNSDDLPSKPVLHRIFQIAKDVDETGFSTVHDILERVNVISRLFHGESDLESQISSMTAARLNKTVVDLGWTDADLMSTEELLDSVRMASEASDVLLTAFSSSEAFGEGRMLTKQFADTSTVPLASLHDDVYAWQSALANLLGLESHLKGLAGKRIAITWGFGNSFTSPAPANSTLIAALAFGAHVRLVAPSKFSFLNRVRRVAEDTSQCCNVSYEEVNEFEGSFKDMDAIFALNWMRLDDFTHPERNQEYAKEFKDWNFDTLPENTIFSTLPHTNSGLLASRKVLGSKQDITHTWLKNRVTVLAATLAYLVETSSSDAPTSIV